MTDTVARRVRAEPGAGPETPVERAADTSGYYGKPIVRPHIWKDAIGWYFFTGGLAGASSVLAEVAELTGRRRLAVHARRAAVAGLLPSPVLLIVDLGRPKRFHHMLRVLRPSSPMSVGSWLLMAYSPLSGGAWILDELGALPRLRRALGAGAALVGPSIATYTAVLVADTATPAWYEARRELPFVFAGSATASAGAASGLLASVDGRLEPLAARVAVLGAVGEVVAAGVMKRRLGPLDTYDSPEAAPYAHAATALSVAGAVATAASLVTPRGRRLLSALGSLAILGGSICERFAVVRAGTASAADPDSVLLQQRRA
ncbi:NrfD/PsrC family molybdoenzyme membrane anchor subunit [Ilumatobacter sp.]|uniref:NrfD/PsrC family molybdoenzyme membrane anchor subunit n=1 Tax=Ilumatobacter sp. TaxID=1967498 RepID=UPI003B515AD1